MQKKPFLLIICVCIVLIALILLAFYFINGGSVNFEDTPESNQAQNLEEIDLKLSAYPLTETEGNVEISVLATIGGKNEIISLTTPDGKTIGYSPERKFSVDRNGDYAFTVRASNGKEVTKIISINNITKISADNPYVPEGFKHIDGTTVNSGFIIEDSSGNQYVWVPVESGKPIRNAPSEKYLEDNYTASALNNSVAKYYGFYIARYEASRDTVNGIVVAKSVRGVEPWSNVNYEDAFNAARNTANAYNYIGVKSALINSYAWDATLNWINTSTINYSTSREYGNYTNQILATGTTEKDIVNEIADLAGNVREWTTEKYDGEIIESIEEDEDNGELKKNNTQTNETEEMEYRVVRGGSATMDKIANSRIGERIDLQDKYWGFRMVLYKE